MNILDEPILPSSQTSPASDANASQSQAGDGLQAVLDGDALNQIRSILISAGVTATMIDLPVGSAETVTTTMIDLPVPVGSAEKLTVSVQEEDTDIETGTGNMRKSGWLKKKMNNMAQARNMSSLDCSTEYPIAEDIYNLFFLSKNWTFPFWWAIAFISQKLILFGIVAYYIYRPGDGFRDQQKGRTDWPAKPIVQATQFLLIPVAIFITEELIITMNVLSVLGWAKLENHPQATRLKFFIANALRALDGMTWLFIIASLMLYAVDILELFLNFAALQFLQSVDNAAYDMAKGGYLFWGCELMATNVSMTTLPTKRGSWREYIDTIMLITIILVLVMFWAVINFA